jgi:hypothetical protein
MLRAIALASSSGCLLLTAEDRAERQRYAADLAAGDGFSFATTAAGDATCSGPEAPDLGPGAFVEVSARARIACGRTAAGRVSCASGPLYAPPVLPTDLVATSVGAGSFDVCAVDDQGAVTCWGTTAEIVGGVPDGVFEQVRVGRWSACALDADGAATCWGQDTIGETRGGDGPFSALAVGPDAACGVDSEGDLSCWGGNASNWSGIGAGPWAEVDLGEDGTCAVGVDGDLACVGPAEASAPEEAARVAVGSGYACAIDLDGGFGCFGPGGPPDWGGPVEGR